MDATPGQAPVETASSGHGGTYPGKAKPTQPRRDQKQKLGSEQDPDKPMKTYSHLQTHQQDGTAGLGETQPVKKGTTALKT